MYGNRNCKKAVKSFCFEIITNLVRKNFDIIKPDHFLPQVYKKFLVCSLFDSLV